MWEADAVPAAPRPALHTSVLDTLGREIVSGDLAEGTVLRIDQLDARHGVSRSVVREAVRVLDSMGLVEARKRLGVRVLPSSSWNVFDPRVIRWRLDGPGREQQLLSLGDLRRGIEPVAAELAAAQASPEQCGVMVGAVVQMAVHAKSGDLEAYLRADQLFHATLLAASGNEMLAALGELVGEAAPCPADAGTVRRHGDAAEAVQSGDAVGAWGAASSLTGYALTPVTDRWTAGNTRTQA